MANASSVFPRNFHKSFPIAVRGEGCWLYTQDGRKFLDAAGSAAVVNIGHGVPEIASAMSAQASQLAFAHTSQFHNSPAEKLASRLLALAPPNFRSGRVYFTSGGSESTETAIKLVRQYFLELGQPNRYRILSRRQSYHGSTLGAMTVSGNLARRAPYQPLLQEWGHIAPCFCYHCPFDKTYPDCHLACANDLETHLTQATSNSDSCLADAASAAAFILEPVVGATLGAVAPPVGYLGRVAEIASSHNLLLIADEVMTGLGRTGKPFSVQHASLEPDIILTGKGVASGYAPLGAVLVSSKISDALQLGSGSFRHGFTYQAHPVSTAAGYAVLDYLESHNLFARVQPAAKTLGAALAPLGYHPHVGDIRGQGLLLGIEFVQNKSTRQPFPASDRIAEKIQAAAMDRGVLTYPTQGCLDGNIGDHILLAPPFILTPGESTIIANALSSALNSVFPN
jgi:adenosylmethionine-8-amino-7-oxononanoate aminotransferase